MCTCNFFFVFDISFTVRLNFKMIFFSAYTTSDINVEKKCVCARAHSYFCEYVTTTSTTVTKNNNKNIIIYYYYITTATSDNNSRNRGETLGGNDDGTPERLTSAWTTVAATDSQAFSGPCASSSESRFSAARYDQLFAANNRARRRRPSVCPSIVGWRATSSALFYYFHDGVAMDFWKKNKIKMNSKLFPRKISQCLGDIILHNIFIYF